jgi:hypothetical protein
MIMTKKRNTSETIFFDLSYALGLLEDVVANDDTVETLAQASDALQRARDTMAAGAIEVFSQAEEIVKTLRRIHSMTTTDPKKLAPGDAAAMVPMIANMISKTLYPIYEPIFAIIGQPAEPEVWYIVSRTRDDETDMPLFWSGTDGWGDILCADTFTDNERVELELPENAAWVSMPGRPWMRFEPPALQLHDIRKSLSDVSDGVLITTKDEAVRRGQTQALRMLAFHLTAVAVRDGIDLPNADLLSAVSSSEKLQKLFPFPE